MKTHPLIHRKGWRWLALGAVFGLLAGPIAAKNVEVRVGVYTLSGPYAVGNLTVYLIHGADQLKGKHLMTLQEALLQKKVIVHETGNVNQIAIENVSVDIEIYIQSGDIIKGGKQDRTIAFDLILPPKSGKVSIASFCVEQGRWTRRGAESAARFESSPNTLPSKDAKIAVKSAGPRANVSDAQRKVWMEVARKQQMLSRVLGKSVKAADSASSLQLTLEDKKLLEAVDAYTRELSGLLEGKPDVIGYAFAINGEINSADIYGSAALFKKLWPGVLKATVIEAIAEIQKDKKFDPVKAETFKAFMLEVEKGKATQKNVTARIHLVTQETKKNVLYVTQDKEHGGVVIRKNYIAK
jgi:hypothetical protein